MQEKNLDLESSSYHSDTYEVSSSKCYARNDFT